MKNQEGQKIKKRCCNKKKRGNFKLRRDITRLELQENTEKIKGGGRKNGEERTKSQRQEIGLSRLDAEKLPDSCTIKKCTEKEEINASRSKHHAKGVAGKHLRHREEKSKLREERK